MRGVGAGRRQGEDCGLCGVQVWSWGSGPLLLRGQLPNSGWQDHFRGISKNKLFFFFLRVPGPSWTPGVRDIHAGLRQHGSRQEGAGGALAPPQNEVSSSAGTSVPRPPPATTSPASLPRECSTLGSAMGLTELS